MFQLEGLYCLLSMAGWPVPQLYLLNSELDFDRDLPRNCPQLYLLYLELDFDRDLPQNSPQLYLLNSELILDRDLPQNLVRHYRFFNMRNLRYLPACGRQIMIIHTYLSTKLILLTVLCISLEKNRILCSK